MCSTLQHKNHLEYGTLVLRKDIGCSEFTCKPLHLRVLHFVQQLVVELCYQPTNIQRDMTHKLLLDYYHYYL